MYCRKCGTELVEEANFCRKCGTAAEIPTRVATLETNVRRATKEFDTSRFDSLVDVETSTNVSSERGGFLSATAKLIKKNRTAVLVATMVIVVILILTGAIIAVGRSGQLNKLDKKITAITVQLRNLEDDRNAFHDRWSAIDQSLSQINGTDFELETKSNDMNDQISRNSQRMDEVDECIENWNREPHYSYSSAVVNTVNTAIREGNPLINEINTIWPAMLNEADQFDSLYSDFSSSMDEIDSLRDDLDDLMDDVESRFEKYEAEIKSIKKQKNTLTAFSFRFNSAFQKLEKRSGDINVEFLKKDIISFERNADDIESRMTRVNQEVEQLSSVYQGVSGKLTDLTNKTNRLAILKDTIHQNHPH